MTLGNNFLDLLKQAEPSPGGGEAPPIESTFWQRFMQSWPQNPEDLAVNGPRGSSYKPPGWNYETAQVGWQGEQLPEGALNWDPNGQAYFGDGVSGWWRKSSYEFGDIWDDPFGVGTLSRTVGFGIGKIFDVLQVPAIATERLLGGGALVLEATAEGSALGALPQPDFLTKNEDDWQIVKILKDTMDILGSLTIEPAWNLARTVVNFDRLDDLYRIAIGDKQTGDMDLDRELGARWQAGRIAFSAFIDSSVKANAIQRIALGEDPAMVAVELALPGAELIGQLIFDPLNKLGSILKARKMAGLATTARKAAVLDEASDLGMAYSRLSEAAKIGDNVAAMERVRDLANVYTGEAGRFAARFEKAAKSTNFFGRTARALRDVEAQKVGDFIRWVANETVEDPEQMLDVLSGLVKASGPADKLDEVVDGLQVLMSNKFKWSASGKLLLSENAVETGIMLRKIIGETAEGALDIKTFLKDLELAKRAKNVESIQDVQRLAKNVAPAEMIENMIKHVDQGSSYDKIFPDLVQRAAAGEAVNPVLLGITKTNTAIQKAVFQPLHSIFTPLYMGIQGGFAVRNWINGVVTSTVDLGKEALGRSLWRSAKYSSNILTGWVGDVALRGIGAGTEEAGGLLNSFLNWGTRAAQKIEMGMDVRIRALVTERTMKQLMVEGRMLPDMGKLRSAGMTDEMATAFQRQLYLNYGDVSKAVTNLFEGSADSISMTWGKAGTWAQQADLQVLDRIRPGLGRLILDDVAKAATPEEAAAALRQYKDEIIDDAYKVKGEHPIPDLELVGDWEQGKDAVMSLMAAGDEGYAATDIVDLYRSQIKANNDAYRAYSILLNQVPLGAMRSKELAAEVVEGVAKTKLDEIEKLVTTARNTVDDVWELANQTNFAVRDEAWDLTRRLNDAPMSEAKLTKLWNDFGMVEVAGAAPEGLNAKLFRQYLWETYYPVQTRNAFAGSLAETYKAVEEGVFQPMAKMGLKEIRISPQLLADARTKFAEASKWKDVKQFQNGYGFAADSQMETLVELGKRAGIETATEGGVETPHLLRAINKYRLPKPPQGGKYPTTAQEFEDMSKLPSSELPEYYREQLRLKASMTAEEVDAFEEGFRTFARDKTGSEGLRVFGSESSFAQWYRDLSPKYYLKTADGTKLTGKQAVVRALRDIVAGEDTDKYVIYEKLRYMLGGDSWGDLPADMEKVITHGWDKLEDVPVGRAIEALNRRSIAKGNMPLAIDDILKKWVREEPLTPPAAEYPTEARRLWDSLSGPPGQDDLTQLFGRMDEDLVTNWGKKINRPAQPQLQAALDEWTAEYVPRLAEGRAVARGVSETMRNFILLNYPDKRRLDVALGYVYMYPFFHTRTPFNWAKRVASSPEAIAGYAKAKDALAQQHAGAPEWWKYQVNTNELFGLDSEDPLFFNLEAAINPLMGLIGVDFEIPEARQHWLGAGVQDLNRFGPATWTPYTWAASVALHLQGEEEANAQRANQHADWVLQQYPLADELGNRYREVGGEKEYAPSPDQMAAAAQKLSSRMLPFSGPLKAGTALLGLNDGKGIEVDPFAGFLYGGQDYYERTRTSRALGMLVNENPDKEAEILENGRLNSGPWWDEATRRAIQPRAWGQLSSFFLGVGFKGRIPQDQEIDVFYNDYFRLWEQRPDLSPAEFQARMGQMKQVYPFMDALLLSRKGGLERDVAYAYNVLQRIPPGSSRDISQAAGLPSDLLSRFYDEKGNIVAWKESDRSRFMAAIVDLGAVLDIPDTATKKQWETAELAYSMMSDMGVSLFGEDVSVKEDVLYGFDWQDQGGREAYDAYLKANPDLQQYLAWKDEQIMANELLGAYYGGIVQIESDLKNKMYTAIEKAVGDIGDLWDAYHRLTSAGLYKQADAFFDQNPQLEQYLTLRDAWLPRLHKAVLEFGNKLPDTMPADLRIEEPTTSGEGELLQQFDQDIQEQKRQQQALQVQNRLYLLGGEALLSMALDYAERGEMNSTLRRALEETAASMGMDYLDLLQYLDLAPLAEQ